MTNLADERQWAIMSLCLKGLEFDVEYMTVNLYSKDDLVVDMAAFYLEEHSEDLIDNMIDWIQDHDGFSKIEVLGQRDSHIRHGPDCEIDTFFRKTFSLSP